MKVLSLAIAGVASVIADPTELPVYSVAEFKKHSAIPDCWTAVGKDIYSTEVELDGVVCANDFSAPKGQDAAAIIAKMTKVGTIAEPTRDSHLPYIVGGVLGASLVVAGVLSMVYLSPSKAAEPDFNTNMVENRV